MKKAIFLLIVFIFNQPGLSKGQVFDLLGTWKVVDVKGYDDSPITQKEKDEYMCSGPRK